MYEHGMTVVLHIHRIISTIEVDVIAVPPELDELTDEENIEDDLIGNTHVSDIAGSTEVFHEERNEDISDVSAKRVRKEEVKWCAQSPCILFSQFRTKGVRAI